MPYEIEVAGRAERTLRMALSDLNGEVAAGVGNDPLMVCLPDQAALVAAIGKLHDLGVTIDKVRRIA